ncbi:MAG: hypothetical protein NVS9B8_13320 [Candidatus Limnocylindrales bacterium]
MDETVLLPSRCKAEGRVVHPDPDAQHLERRRYKSDIQKRLSSRLESLDCRLAGGKAGGELALGPADGLSRRLDDNADSGHEGRFVDATC